MADAITIKALQDASLDAKSLEEVVNGDEAKQVTTRKGETYPSVKKAITQMFENGGLPAVPFATKALMTASSLVDGKYAMVTDDTVNNGLYVKEAGAWVKSSYDPVLSANTYTDSVRNDVLKEANDISANYAGYSLLDTELMLNKGLSGGFGVNMINLVNSTNGVSYVVEVGVIKTISINKSASDRFRVAAFESYPSSNAVMGTLVFDNSLTHVATITVDSNIKFLVITVSATNQAITLAVSEGANPVGFISDRVERLGNILGYVYYDALVLAGKGLSGTTGVKDAKLPNAATARGYIVEVSAGDVITINKGVSDRFRVAAFDAYPPTENGEIIFSDYDAIKATVTVPAWANTLFIFTSVSSQDTPISVTKSSGGVGTIESELRDMRNKGLNAFEGKKIGAIGDSITWGFRPRNDIDGVTGEQMQSWLVLTANKLGMTYDNKGSSGSTLGANSTAANSPMTRRFGALANDCDFVVVMGGTNDVRKGVPLGTIDDRTDTTYYGALHVICEGLINKYQINQGLEIGKTKHIILATPIKLLETGSTLNTNLQAYAQAVREVAEYYSLPVLDLNKYSNINPHVLQTVQGTESGYMGVYNPYITDGTHPTQQGHEMMANYVTGFLKTLV